MAIELRIEDVVSRKDNKEEEKNAREIAIQQHNDRAAKFEAARKEAEEAFDAKVEEDKAKKRAEEGEAASDEEKDEAEKKDEPQFPLEEFIAEFNSQYPEIDIPKEVIEDTDSDYDLAYSPPSFE